MKRLIVPVAISILFAVSAQADGINNPQGYGAYGQSDPSPTSIVSQQGSYGQLLQQAMQTGLQGLSGGSGTGVSVPSGMGLGLDSGGGSSSAFGTSIGTGSGSAFGTSIGTGSGSAFGTSIGTGSGSAFGTSIGTAGALGGTGIGTAGSFGGSTSGASSFSGLGAASTFGTGGTNLGGGLGSAGSIDSNSSINTPLPGGIGPAPGAPDATAGDTTTPDSNNADLSMPTSPFAKPPASADDMAPSATPSPAVADTPMRRALSAVRLAKYDQALTMLSQILQSDPGNSQAHYLKAVAFVMTRHYSQAADEYRQCLKLNPAPDIANRARAGLAKLSH
jgi:hypothetical protein